MKVAPVGQATVLFGNNGLRILVARYVSGAKE